MSPLRRDTASSPDREHPAVRTSRTSTPPSRLSVPTAYAGAITVFIEGFESFRDASFENSPGFLCTFTKFVPGPGSGIGALKTSDMENCAQDDVRHISVRPRKSNSIRTHRTTRTPGFLTGITSHGTPSTRNHRTRGEAPKQCRSTISGRQVSGNWLLAIVSSCQHAEKTVSGKEVNSRNGSHSYQRRV